MNPKLQQGKLTLIFTMKIVNGLDRLIHGLWRMFNDTVLILVFFSLANVKVMLFDEITNPRKAIVRVAIKIISLDLSQILVPLK